MTATGSPTPSRDFTVAVIVVAQERVLLHWHRKLGRWLPPGGHIEPNELPDDAARREVLEETGLHVELVGERGLPEDYPGQPRQLLLPAGIQLEDISANHQHIDLVYFARPEVDGHGCGLPRLPAEAGWFGEEQFATLPLTEEVAAWCRRAIREAGAVVATDTGSTECR